ncbi:MAG: DNA recombination protein RmuC [Acidobacteriota bacterium]|jgi:DNA recombination protein RmuC
MTSTLIVVLLILLALAVLVLGLALWRASRGRGGKALDSMKSELSVRLENVQARQAELQGLLQKQMSDTFQLLQSRLSSQETALREQLTHQTTSMQGQTNILQKHMQSTQATLSQVTEKMGMVHQAAVRMGELGKEMEALQRLLKAPKARGTLGELGLDVLLSDLVPRDRILHPYSFSDGKAVDFALRLDKGLLPIDAKFPMEDFERYLAAPEEEKPRARRDFQSNLKKKIDSISKLYVRPGEGTLPLALMYLPAESVYYEAFISREVQEEDLWQYAFDRSVLPLSPATMTAYLKTVVMGLRAAAVEQHARDVLQLLGTLERDLGAFREGYGVLGRHLTNASQKYADTERELQKLELHLNRAQELGQDDKEQA